jgi:hypothetical protein
MGGCAACWSGGGSGGGEHLGFDALPLPIVEAELPDEVRPVA